MSDSVRPRRVNGLSSPLTAAQVSTWVFLPILVVEFLVFVSPMLPLAASIPCTLVFCGFAGAATYFGYMAMKIDPADPRLFTEGGNGANDNSNGHSRNHPWDPDAPTKQCWICDVQVGEKSMHCKFCNKCIDHFDHHCMWLNTCVGKANYSYFFRTMTCITGLLLVQSVIQIALVLDIYLGNGASKQRSEEWFNADATIAVVVVMSTFVVCDLVALTLIVQLLVFHIKLQRDGLSTYQFIVQDNQRRREQTRLENDLQHRRTLAISKATEDGNVYLVFRLRSGRFLRQSCGLACCDPLQLVEKREHEAATTAIQNGNGHVHDSPASSDEQGGDGSRAE